jgi:GrpB-like predicted nucleotidyltransferase (UPF0157 family)
LVQSHKREVVVVLPDPNWDQQFELESKILKNIFGELVVQIYHIGSTAIRNIFSKPIIDLMPEVTDITRVDDFNDKMIEKGYLPKGEFGIPNRRFFIKGNEINHLNHIHIFEKGSSKIESHILFRDYLNNHSVEAKKYSELKVKLAKEYQFDIIGYMNGKDNFIKNIDEKAKRWKQQVI